MHFSLYSSSLVLLFRNEEELVALSVHFSFRRVAATGFRSISVAIINSS